MTKYSALVVRHRRNPSHFMKCLPLTASMARFFVFSIYLFRSFRQFVCVCVYLSFTVFFFVLSFEVESIPWVRKKRRRNARATQRFIKSKSRVCAVNVYSGTIGALVTLWHCFPSTIPSSLKSIESLVYFTVASCHVFFQFIFISFVYSLPLSLSLLQHIHFFHLLFARSFTQFV